jgi:hypothetical protein
MPQGAGCRAGWRGARLPAAVVRQEFADSRIAQPRAARVRPLLPLLLLLLLLPPLYLLPLLVLSRRIGAGRSLFGRSTGGGGAALARVRRRGS